MWVSSKKVKLIDGFGFTSSYNILADSFALGNFNFYARTTLFEKFNISTVLSMDPYATDKFGYRINQYDINLIQFYDKHGDKFDDIEDNVLNTIATVHRSSSLIETLNSRLRPYLDPRKGFKKERFQLIKFALNHIPLMRSANKKMKGKSTAEIFTQVDNIDFISLLGFQRFQRAA